MTPKDFIRTFIAVEIPSGIKEEMARVQAGLKESGAYVGWVRPEGIHLTLKFLGDVEASRIDELAAAVQDAARGTGPVRLDVRGIGVFPNARAPRVVWLGVSGEVDALSALADRIEAACERLGYPREKRGFTPHLTLGRVKSPGRRESLMRKVAEYEKADLGGFTAESVSIMKSELKPSGAVYTEMRRIELGK